MKCFHGHQHLILLVLVVVWNARLRSHGFLIHSNKVQKAVNPIAAVQSGDSKRSLLKASEDKMKDRGQSTILSSSTNAASFETRRNSVVSKKKPTARSVAVSALVKNKRGSEFSLQRLESDNSFTALVDQRDRSFARLLVTAVERRMGQIDKILSLCIKTYPPKRGKQDAFVQACLRVGAAQLLFLDVADYAAIKETIDVLRMNPKVQIPEAKIKFANAVLRRISREGEEMLATHSSPEENIAPWLLREWRSSWGEANTKKVATQLMKEPRVDLSIKYPFGASPEERALELERIRNEFGNDTIVLPHGSLRVGESMTGAVAEWPMYQAGLWWVQDASAALPALALYNALKHDGNIQDMHVLDCCAAPGGKTAQLISLGFGHVTAVEANARRSRRLVENLERLNMQDRCTVDVADGSEWQPSDRDTKISGVLLDVPCSATGTGSKRPDVLRRDEDLGNLLELQERLAQHCADDVLDRNGVMVYATCSLLKKESEEQVHKLLSRGSSNNSCATMETIPFVPGEIPGFDEAIDENGWLRVLPGVLPGSLSSCDGFFVARLGKV